MKVADLIAALDFIGKSYRNKEGSKPADAVLKLLSQLKGYEIGTLADWARLQESSKSISKKKIKATIEQEKLRVVLTSLENVDDQIALSSKIRNLNSELSAEDWKAVAKQLSGKSQGSGKASREFVETYFSNNLLLKNRLDSVKRIHG
jgi:hypothetical protein